LLFEHEFYERSDSQKYVIAYKDGILDLKTGEFRKGILPEDYLTKTLSFDYVGCKDDDEDVQFVRNELIKICNNNKGHFDYYCSTIGVALTGDASHAQELYLVLGQTASNGKSVVFSALEEIAPNYVMKVPGNLYDKNNANVHKTIDVLRGIRIAYINEMTTVEKNTEMLKDIADGKSFPYNKMYGVQQEMPFTLKQFIVSNHSINCAADNGIARRLRQMQMNSKFVKEGEGEIDENKKIFRTVNDFDKILYEKYKHALLHLLFSYATKFVQKKHVKEPQPKEG
jgi:phage/plasmid-associated DNA primase